MKLVLVWLFVIIPLFWGVKKSVEKSRPLFSGSASVPASTPAK